MRNFLIQVTLYMWEVIPKIAIYIKTCKTANMYSHPCGTLIKTALRISPTIRTHTHTLRTTEQNFMKAAVENFTEQLPSNFNLFMLITHSSWPLYMKIYTSFCAHEHLHP